MVDDIHPDGPRPDPADGSTAPPSATPDFPTVMPASPPQLPEGPFTPVVPVPPAAPTEPDRALDGELARSARLEGLGPPEGSAEAAESGDRPAAPRGGTVPVLAAPAEEDATTIATTDEGAPLAAPAAPKKKKKQGSFLRELPVLLVIAFALALLIKAFLIQAFFIPSGSMENTLQIKDRVLVNKLVYRFRDIHRGEVVVFNGLDSFTPETIVPPPANAFDSGRRKVLQALGLGTPGEKDFIKRVIGIPGDTVACCDQGRVTVNGEAIDEPYVFENDEREFGPEVVPEGKLFVMGDHRGASDDSRAKGTVPSDKVIGRAFVVIWPPGNVKGLKVPPQLEGTKGALAPLAEPLPSAPWSLVVLPPVLGVVGAVPLHLLQRGARRRWPARPWPRRRGRA